MSDLIEREDALTAVGEAIFEGRSWYDALVYVPSAERKGKWLDGCQYGMSGTYWYRYCSECGYTREDDNIDKDSNYCPHCGARMEGEEE